MLLPVCFVYILGFIIGIPIFTLVAAGPDGLKELWHGILQFPSKMKNLNVYRDIISVSFNKENYKHTLLVSFSCVILACVAAFLGKSWVVDKFCPYAIVVNGSSDDIHYKTYIALGSPTIHEEPYDAKVGNTLIVNDSECELYYYAVTYSSREMQLSGMPSFSSVIRPGRVESFSSYPDHFFRRPSKSKKSVKKLETEYVLDVKPR